MAHANLSPSGATRWINCPGSVALCATLPKKSSSYADEGSAAHALAEKTLAPGGMQSPATALGMYLRQEGREWYLHKDKPKSGVFYPVTQEMVDAVTIYTDYVESFDSDDQKYFEAKLDIGWVYPGIFGTVDCGIHETFTKTLNIIDYKHGAGVAVEVEDNPQLKIYALGAIGKDARKSNIEKVRITIVQPRKEHRDGPIRHWDTTVKELMDWAEQELIPAAQATELDSAPFSPGEKQCRWCEASRQSKCPALLGTVQEITGMSMLTPIIEVPALPNPADMTAADKVKLITLAGVLETWIENVRANVLEEAQRGIPFPGLKLVHKQTRRAWGNEDEVRAALQPVLGDALYTKPTLISPSAAEKLLGKQKAVIAPLIVKPVGDLTIVADHDKRHAVNPLESLALLYDDL